VDKYPKSRWAPDSLERTGIYYWQGLDDSENAINTFEVLIDKYPNDNVVSYAYYWIGTIYLKQNQFDLAKKKFLYVQSTWPNSEMAERSKNH